MSQSEQYSEDFSSRITAGMKEANDLRSRYYSALKSNEVTFAYVVDLSKDEDYKALAKMKLIRMLSDRPRWTQSSALEALVHLGLSQSSVIQNIRKNRSKVDGFARLMDSDPEKWRARPKMPDGWPFFGKLSEVISPKNNIPEVPDELLSLFGDDDDDGVDDSILESLR